MKKIFLLLAFTGLVGATSANSLVTLTKGTIIAFSGDDKKQEGKKKCDKKSCCKSSKEAKSTASCSAGKEAKACTHNAKGKETAATTNVKATAVSVSPSESVNTK